MGALKYFMLKVDPKKRMLFDPKESLILMVIRDHLFIHSCSYSNYGKKYNKEVEYTLEGLELTEKERTLIKQINDFPTIIQEAANSYSPALIANYVYDLVKEFNGFYQNVPILIGEDKNQVAFRIALCQMVARVSKTGMKLLG